MSPDALGTILRAARRPEPAQPASSSDPTTLLLDYAGALQRSGLPAEVFNQLVGNGAITAYGQDSHKFDPRQIDAALQEKD